MEEFINMEQSLVVIKGEIKIPGGCAKSFVLNEELMQVAVRPAERILKDVMEPQERHMSPNINTAPNRWSNVLNGDLELKDP